MAVTDTGDTVTAVPDPPVVFRVDLIDRFMPTAPREQAVKLGLNRTHWLDLRAGRKTPSLRVALKIARRSGSTVETLFGEAA